MNANSKTSKGSKDEVEDISDSKNIFVDYSDDGDIFIAYPETQRLHIWSTNSEGDCLVLSMVGTFQTDSVKAFKCNGYKSSLTIEHFGVNDDNYLVSYSPSGMSKVELPSIFSGLNLFTIKASSSYIVVGNDQGLLYILSNEFDYLEPANTKNALGAIKKEICNPILIDKKIYIQDHEIVLQTSVSSSTNQPIFDLIDNWLVYSPTKFEYLHTKATNTQFKDETDIDPFKRQEKELLPIRKPNMFTPMILPRRGPLLHKVLTDFSNSASDSLFRVSELTVKNYKKQLVVTDVSINSISKGLGKLISNTVTSTANTIKKQASSMKPNNNQLIKVVDLATDKILGTFKPPGGINNISLSPYDLQMVQTTLKGDRFYMWDLYKLPQEISLIGEFARGKTSATIEEIFWFINSHELDTVNQYGKATTIKANNSGFGCITKATGTVHWFNTNYLSGNSDNFPNTYKGVKKSTNFLDNWILSSVGAKKFIPLPQNSHLVKSTDKTSDKSVNQLAILDNNNQLKLISTLNGAHMYKYDLSSTDKITEEYLEKTNSDVSGENEVIQPLGQAEIETCSPFLHMINNGLIEFATFQSDSDLKSKVFGADIKSNTLKPFSNHPIEVDFENEISLGDTSINTGSIKYDEAPNVKIEDFLTVEILEPEDALIESLSARDDERTVDDTVNGKVSIVDENMNTSNGDSIHSIKQDG